MFTKLWDNQINSGEGTWTGPIHYSPSWNHKISSIIYVERFLLFIVVQHRKHLEPAIEINSRKIYFRMWWKSVVLFFQRRTFGVITTRSKYKFYHYILYYHFWFFLRLIASIHYYCYFNNILIIRSLLWLEPQLCVVRTSSQMLICPDKASF